MPHYSWDNARLKINQKIKQQQPPPDKAVAVVFKRQKLNQIAEL